MITVYFMRGQEKIPVQVDEGMSLMEAARDFANQSIEEIPADCSGCCACATCHVKIDRNWTHIVGQPNLDSAETELIEYEKGYDLSLRYSVGLDDYMVGLQGIMGKTVFGEDFYQVGVFTRW